MTRRRRILHAVMMITDDDEYVDADEDRHYIQRGRARLAMSKVKRAKEKVDDFLLRPLNSIDLRENVVERPRPYPRPVPVRGLYVFSEIPHLLTR